FDGYPAKRPWYPFTYELYQNIIPSAADGYPYSAKILLTHKATPLLAAPAGQTQIGMLKDPTKIPLFIASDIVIGETTMYADYVLPDLSYMERWGVSHTTPAILTTVSKIRQPTMAPLTETVAVDGEEMPISLEAFLLDVGKRLNIPGIGADALGSGYPLDRPEHYYLAMSANLAFGDKEDGSETLPAADDVEMEIFRQARSHLPGSVYDEGVWQRSVPADLWPSVVSFLNRGGRFASTDKSYKDDEWIAKQWKGRWNLYVEKVAKGRNSINGERFDGLPRVDPIMDVAGNPIDDADYDLTLITHKEIVGGQSRTHGAGWLQRAVMPENHVLLNVKDAAARGMKDDDEVRIVSESLPDGTFDLGDGRTHAVQGKVKTIEGLRPGTVTVSWSFGHWAYGSNDVVIDGEVIEGDPTRATGLVPNPSMRVDPVMGDVCLTDPIGGSASFYDTKVRVEKI
ncbi:MAG: molybdopterin oxidoreductase, partial [Nitrospirae bacterium]|nr:molybdopterin oxidoreductase [Nitrospirota bacterium]